MCALGSFLPDSDHHHLLYFAVLLRDPKAWPETGRFPGKSHPWTQHAHLGGRDGLPCLLNTLSSLSWVALAFPPGKNFEGVLLVSGPLSTAGLSSESAPHRPLPRWSSPGLGKRGGLLGVALCFSEVGSLSGPRGLLVLEAEPSRGAGQAGVRVESSGALRLSSSSSWGRVTLLKVGGRLRERLRRES